jgi:hypothetical protein
MRSLDFYCRGTRRCRVGQDRNASSVVAVLAPLPLLLLALASPSAAITVNPVVSDPPVLAPNIPTRVRVKTKIDLLPGDAPVARVKLLRLGQDGTAKVIATMRDDGYKWDDQAKDGIWTAEIAIHESGDSGLLLQASATLQGSEQSFTSGITQIPFSSSKGTATLTVSVVGEASEAPDPERAPATDNIQIKINDILVGRTNEQGKLTVPVNAESLSILAYSVDKDKDGELLDRKKYSPTKYPIGIGMGGADPSPGEKIEIEIVVGDGKEMWEDADVTVDEISEGLLPSTASTFTMRFFREKNNEISIPITKQSGYCTLRDEKNADEDIDVGIQNDGSIRIPMAILAPFLRSMEGRLTMKCGFNASGNIDGLFYGKARFRYGQHRIQGKLVAPPSNPTLPVGNIVVTAKLVGTSFEITTKTDGEGNFLFPLLPPGTFELKASAMTADTPFAGTSAFDLSGNLSVQLVLQGEPERQKNEPGFTVR